MEVIFAVLGLVVLLALISWLFNITDERQTPPKKKHHKRPKRKG